VTDVVAGSRRVAISHADRVLFPARGLTKLDLARYYSSVSEAMIPHVRGRPLALQIFPEGVDRAGYFLKDAPRHFPSWLTTVAIARREGGTIHQVLANNAATLVYLAGQNAITRFPRGPWTPRHDLIRRCARRW
jgi:bifunctional non-homologous end joining protein LigD